MKKYNLWLLVSLLLGCEKIHYYPDKAIDIEPSKLIAHRGGKSWQFRENNLEGIKDALKYMDGIEVDVQISKNESIWLSHSATVEGCNTSLKCFAETQDEDIKAIKLCGSEDISYTMLEDVFIFIADSFPEKPICIDLKAWVPCSANSAGIEGMMDKESEVIINLAQKYGITKNLLFETETASVLDFVRSKNTDSKTYITSFGDFERAMLIALKGNYSGISFKNGEEEILTKEKVDLLHKKGLKIMVWNLISQDKIEGLKEIGVDYIQVDF